MTDNNLTRIVIDSNGKVLESSTKLIPSSIIPVGQPRLERIYDGEEKEAIELIHKIAPLKANSFALSNVIPEKDSRMRSLDYFSVQFYTATY